MNKKKTVIVLGKGTLAIKIAKWFQKSSDYELIYIVPVVPEPIWTSSFIKWAEKNNVPYISSGDYKDISRVTEKDWKVDLAFSIFYDKIIKQWFISKCKKILNLHNGPLPRYRGVSPINWALKNNEEYHGTTIHEITPRVDDGPIIAQITYSIYPNNDEVIDVYKRALEYGWALFKQTMPLIYKIVPKQQDESKVSYFSLKENHLLKERKGFKRSILT